MDMVSDDVLLKLATANQLSEGLLSQLIATRLSEIGGALAPNDPKRWQVSHDQAVQAVLIASIGASRDARSAGYQPNNIPTSIENSTAEIAAQ